MYELGIAHRASTHAFKVKEQKEASQTLLFNWLGTHLDSKEVNKILKQINTDNFYTQEKEKEKKETGKKEESDQLKSIRKLMGVMAGKQ